MAPAATDSTKDLTPTPTVHLLLILDPSTPINSLDIIPPRITFPANPPLGIMVCGKFDNRRKRVALTSAPLFA